MSLETNKALVRRHMDEAFTNHNVAVLDETLSHDYVDHTNPPGWPLGREGHRQILVLYHAAFPDFRYDIEHEVAEGDMVVVRGTYTGTHNGEFLALLLPGYMSRQQGCISGASPTTRSLNTGATMTISE
jgi:predicted ester cyclase